jgi:hypothetical protein
LIGGVKRNGHKSVFRQFPRRQTGCLLLHAASAMRNDYRRIFLAFLKSVRDVVNRGNGDVLPIFVEKSYFLHALNSLIGEIPQMPRFGRAHPSARDDDRLNFLGYDQLISP